MSKQNKIPTSLPETNYSLLYSYIFMMCLLLFGAQYMYDENQNKVMKAQLELIEKNHKRIKDNIIYQHDVNILNIRVLGRMNDMNVTKLLEKIHVSK